MSNQEKMMNDTMKEILIDGIVTMEECLCQMDEKELSEFRNKLRCMSLEKVHEVSNEYNCISGGR